MTPPGEPDVEEMVAAVKAESDRAMLSREEQDRVRILLKRVDVYSRTAIGDPENPKAKLKELTGMEYDDIRRKARV